MDKLQAIRNIAFDLDDTPVGSTPGLTLAVDDALYVLELPVVEEECVVIWVGSGAGALMERALTWARQEHMALRAAIGKPSVDNHDIPQGEQLCTLRKLFDRYCVETVEEGSFLFPAVADTLGVPYARGLPLVLVVSKPTPLVAPLLDALGIAKYLIVVIGGDDVQSKRPYPESLLLVAGKLSLTPAGLLFVDDSCDNIQAAKTTGCCSVDLTYGYNYGKPFALSEPDYLFDQLNELLSALGLPHSETQELKHD